MVHTSMIHATQLAYNFAWYILYQVLVYFVFALSTRRTGPMPNLNIFHTIIVTGDKDQDQQSTAILKQRAKQTRCSGKSSGHLHLIDGVPKDALLSRTFLSVEGIVCTPLTLTLT